MTIFIHELKQGFKSFCIWTASIAFLIVICVFMFPEMKNEMDSVTEMFASMGTFTSAFGMDKMDFGTLIGFYSVECGNILGLGGAFFAALIAVSVLAKEEKEHTAEFLFTHTESRVKIVTEKLASVIVRIIAMNLIIWLLSALSVIAIGEEVPWKEITLIHASYTLLQIELAGICFAFSAFVRRGSLGIGLGISALMYFLNIIANISDSAGFLKYITPFGYTESSDIINSGSLDGTKLLLGAAYTVVGIVIGYVVYCRKDLK